jgi:hypothetical protein
MRERLRVEAAGLGHARPFAPNELVVYPTARPHERLTIPMLGIELLSGLEAAVAGIRTWDDPRIGPRIGPNTAGPRVTLDAGGEG